MLLGGSHGSGESSSKEQADFGANDIDWRALGLAIAFTLLATTIVSARWFARHRLAQCVGLDDYVILLSLVSWLPTYRARKPHGLTRDFLDALMGNDRTHWCGSKWRYGRIRRSSRHHHRRSARSSKQRPLDPHRQHYESINCTPIPSYLQQSHNSDNMLRLPASTLSSSIMGRLRRNFSVLANRETLASSATRPLHERQNILAVSRRHRHWLRLPHPLASAASDHQPPSPSQTKDRFNPSLHPRLSRLPRKRCAPQHGPHSRKRQTLRGLCLMGHYLVSRRSERRNHLCEFAEPETACYEALS